MSTAQLPKAQRQLRPWEHIVINRLRRYCEDEGLTEFSSDTFRLLNLQQFVTGSHGIGGFFARLKHNKVVEEVGWVRSVIPSNHGRKIRVYEWTEE